MCIYYVAVMGCNDRDRIAESIVLIDYVSSDDIAIDGGLSMNEEMIANLDRSYTVYLLLFRR